MYGKNDPGLHFHFSIQARFLTIPGITLSTTFDTINLSPLQGIIVTYVDDTLNAGTPAFLRSIASVLATNDTHKPYHDEVQFASITARSETTGIHCDADACSRTLAPLPLHPPLSYPLPSRKPLHSLAAKLLLVGRFARPHILTNATNLAHIFRPIGADARRANDTLERTLCLPVTLHYQRLDPATLRIDVYADYYGPSFSPLDRRQLDYLITLTDQSNRFSALHWASHKPHRVCRGSCAGELLAFADAVAATLDVRFLL